MAEVTIRLPKRQTLLVKEPGVEVTAREAPPSMTYTTPSVKVGMEPMVAFMTYLDNNPVELSANTVRSTTNDVEITASTERTVQSDDPIPVEVEGSTRRIVTTDVEITAPLVRNVTSFKVNLEYSTRRDVINSGDLEVGLRRDVESRIEIEATTTRLVLNDEDSEVGIPSKEYGSFVEPNKLFRVQHDVLNEDVSDNPYFERQISNLRNAALLTRNQTVIKAINELFVSQREAFLSTFTALEKVNVTLGDVVVDKELKAKYAKMGAENVIDGLVKLSANIDSIVDFIGMQADSLPYYEELGYKDLLETLKGMNEKIKSIDFEWSDWTTDDLGRMFRATDYIPEIKDQVFTLLDQMQEEIDAFKNGLARQFLNLKSETELTLAHQYQTLIEKMNSPYERITEQEVRDMFRAIGQDAVPDDDEDVYFQMFQSLAERLKVAEESFESQIDAIKRNQLELLQDLEGWANVTLREVQEMFGDISEDEDAQDVYVELFRTFSERLDAYQTMFEQMLAGLDERVKQCELLDDWAAITENEVKRIFDLMDPDAEPDEDRYAELFQILSDRIADNRERIESYIEYSVSQIDDYASITEQEVKRIFELLQDPEDPERTFEDYVIELIKGLTDRLVVEEESTVVIRDLIRHMEESNISITEAEVRRIFSLLKDEDEPEEDFEARLIGIIKALDDRIAEQEDVAVLLQQLIEQLQSENASITEEEVHSLFAMLQEEDVEAFKEALTLTINRLDARVAEQERISQELKALTDHLQNENVNITEEEVLKIFTILQEDSESERSFEERITSAIAEWQDRIIDAEDVVAELKTLLERHLESGSDITEEEVREIFRNLVTGEDETTFEERVTDIINALMDRVMIAELTAARLGEVADQLKAENTDITQEEIMDLFALIQESEEDYEQRIVSAITEWQDRVVAESRRIDSLEEAVERLKVSGIDVTEEEILRIFSLLKDEDEPEEDFEARLIGIINGLADRLAAEEASTVEIRDVLRRMEEDTVSITEEDIRSLFEVLQGESEEDFEARVNAAINAWQARIAANEDEVDGLKTTIQSIQEEHASITESEVLRIFETLQSESEEGFEERIAAIIREWKVRVVDAETAVEAIQALVEAIQAENASITEEEVRSLFAMLQEEDVEAFKDALVTIVNRLDARVAEQEAVSQELKELTEQLKSENASITEEEVRALFAMLQEEDVESFKDALASIVNRLEERVDDAESDVDRIKVLTEAMQAENADVTEEEVRRLFAMFESGEGSGEDDSFEARVSEIINSLIDRIVAQEEESERLKDRIDTLEGQIDGFNRGLDLLSRSISARVTDFTNEVNDKVRSILAALENAQDAIEGKVTYDTLVAYLETEMASTKTTLDSLDNRVTGLESKVESAFTEDDISTVDDIKALFDPLAWIDNYEEATEDDIRDMFEPKTDEEGNPEPSTAETVQEILDIIVTEESIMDLFRPYIGDVEVHTMEELLEALANRNNV